MCKARDRKARLRSYLFDFMWEDRFQLCIEGPKPRPQSQFRWRSKRKGSPQGASITHDLPRLPTRPEALR